MKPLTGGVAIENVLQSVTYRSSRVGRHTGRTRIRHGGHSQDCSVLKQNTASYNVVMFGTDLATLNLEVDLELETSKADTSLCVPKSDY